MNNLLLYCGLIDAEIRASDKDLPVLVISSKTKVVLYPYLKNSSWTRYEKASRVLLLDDLRIFLKSIVSGRYVWRILLEIDLVPSIKLHIDGLNFLHSVNEMSSMFSRICIPKCGNLKHTTSIFAGCDDTEFVRSWIYLDATSYF